MDDVQTGEYGQSYNESFSGLQLNDIEEKQNILRERLLLIGKNLVETKEEMGSKMLDVKKDLELLKHDIGRMKSFIDSISMQIGKLAKKEDLDILAKQMKMFRPFAGGK